MTGQMVEHKKGDYKYNYNGTFYYESLGNRDIYGK
jgi:YHS domain-containing protein